MLNRPQIALNILKRRNPIMYQTYSLIAAVLLFCTLFAVLDNSPGSIQNDYDYFKSAAASSPQINCSIPQSSLLEIIKPEKTQSYNTQIVSAFLKLSYHLLSQSYDCHPGYSCTYSFDCQQVFLLLDLPPPALL